MTLTRFPENTPTYSLTGFIILLLTLTLCGCSNDVADGSVTDVECMVGTVVDVSGKPKAGIKAYCYHPEFMPFTDDTILYESDNESNDVGEYEFSDFTTGKYNIITFDKDTSLAGFRQVDTGSFVITDKKSGYIKGEDIVKEINSSIPGIFFNTDIPIVMQIKGTPFYTYLDSSGYFNQRVPQGIFDFHLSFPENPEMKPHEFLQIPVPFPPKTLFTLTIPDITPPPTIQHVTETIVTDRSVFFDWLEVTDNSSIAGYEIRYFATNTPHEVETLFTVYSELTITDLKRDTEYSFEGRTKDLMSNYSTWTSPPTIITTSKEVDKMGPVINEAWATVNNATEVTVYWSEGQDMNGVKKYHLEWGKSLDYENTKTTVEVPHHNEVSIFNYNITNLEPNTQYTAKVKGEDILSNITREPTTTNFTPK